MTAKTMSLSELLHVCHVPSCTAITMNPFLHQLNNHSDQLSDTAKEWLGEESVRRERVIFDYRKRQDKLQPTSLRPTEPPVSSSPSSKNAATKFGSSHIAGKSKKLSLLPSHLQSRKRKRKSANSPFSPASFLNEKSGFVGIPELMTAVQMTGAYLNRACEDKCEESLINFSPLHVPMKENGLAKENSISPHTKNASKFESSSSVRKRTCAAKSSLSEDSTKTLLSKKESKKCKKQNLTDKATKIIKPELNSSDATTSLGLNKQKPPKSTSLPLKKAMKPKASKSFSSSDAQDIELNSTGLSNDQSTLTPGEIKIKAEPNEKDICKSKPSPTGACEDEDGIQIISVLSGKAELSRVKVQSEDMNTSVHSSDSDVVISYSTIQTPMYDPNKPIKIEKNVASTNSPQHSRKRSAASSSSEQPNINVANSIKKEPTHPFDSCEKVPSSVTRPSNGYSSSAEPVFENGTSSATNSSLYSLEHLSYNFVLCDYVRECLSLCTEQSGLLAKQSALSVQQVLIVLLFLRGALLEFLCDMCVCSVMKPVTPTSQGTVMLKLIPGAKETLELSLKEFQYLKDFVRFVRPALADSMYGRVFLMDSRAPFDVESLRQAITTCWNLANVNVGLLDALKSVAASYGRKL